jgi:cell division transport system permease protein
MTTLKTTWHHIRRSPFQSLIAFLVMFICFFTISTLLLTSQGMSLVLKYFETRPEVTIYLQDGLDKDTVDSLQKELSSYPDIKEIRFISKEKALDIYKEQNQDNPLLTEMVTASILPASFEISATNPEVLNQIAQNFSSKTNMVDEIIYQKNMVETILVWTRFIRKTGIIIASSTLVFTFFLVLIIIGMKITSRKEEIRISRLLGASKYYVKKSFLLEGLFYGLFGSLFGAGLVFCGTLYFRTRINSYFAPIDFIPGNIGFFAILLLAQITFGITIGYLASWIGVKRYIKY